MMYYLSYIMTVNDISSDAAVSTPVGLDQTTFQVAHIFQYTITEYHKD
jgi:hypothetical protein